MITILQFFLWFYNLCKKAAEFLASVPGMITAGLAAFTAFFANLFANFPWTDEIVRRIDSISSTVSQFVNGDHGQVIPIFVDWFAFDTLMDVLLVVLACTFGAFFAVILTIFSAFVILIPVVWGIRLVIKAVRVASVGLIEA